MTLPIINSTPDDSYHGLPCAPYLCQAFDSDGNLIPDLAVIGLNLQSIPSRAWLLSCRAALDEFISNFPTDHAVEIYNQELRDRIEASIGPVSSTPTPPKKPGWIYIIKSGSLYKIGRTKNLKSRVKTYTTENPHGSTLISSEQVSDYQAVESALHPQFSHKRRVGEWFALNHKELRQAQAALKQYTLQ